ncbi:MAG: ABC transporter ATP-binding protein [Rhizobiaceae bacterium]
MSLLEVRDLTIRFPLASGLAVHAVDGVSFTVDEGESYGIVGESGSGKSTTARALMRLLEPSSGSVRLGDHILTELDGNALIEVRHLLQMIFQDPYSSLNPRLRAGDAVREPLDLMRLGTRKERDERVRQMLHAVGLHPEAARLFPHQFSGGQRQRLCIARALVTEPKLVVCDEPVSALDVAIQAQILNMLRRLQEEKGLTYVFISHDLAVIQHICTHVAVMYMGEIVEEAPVARFFSAASHPYSWSLMAAALSPQDRMRDAPDFTIEGEPPSPIDPPKGCRFAGRCPFASGKCRAEKPGLRTVERGHRVACHYAGEIDPPLAQLAAFERGGERTGGRKTY